MVDLRRRRRSERRVARYAWPAAVGAAGVAWYGADSLRHRRESGHGYDVRGDVEVRSPEFLRAAEALTGAPISWGSDVELLINGDQIFPRYLRAIREAQHNEEFAGLLTEQFERDLEVSERIAPERWQSRGPLQRAGEAAIALARREL